MSRRKQVIAALRRAREIHRQWAKDNPQGLIGKWGGNRRHHIYWAGVYTAALRELGAE